MTNQDFAIFALAQAVPGPNMILMMGFVGWKVWEFPELWRAHLRPSGRPAPYILLPTAYGIGSAPPHGSTSCASDWFPLP
jgi:hypothetical protein